MAYSAVTQPRPLPLRHRGTPWVTEAAHSTRVLPNSTSTEPSAWSSQPRAMRTSRSWSGVRPSMRVMPTTLEARADTDSQVVRRTGRRDLDRAVEGRLRVAPRNHRVVPRGQVGQDQSAYAGSGGGLRGLPGGEVQVGRRVVVAPGLEGGLEQREVGTPGQLDERRRTARCRRSRPARRRRARRASPRSRRGAPSGRRSRSADRTGGCPPSTRRSRTTRPDPAARPARRHAPGARHRRPGPRRAAGRSGGAGRRCAPRTAAGGRCSGRGAGG